MPVMWKEAIQYVADKLGYEVTGYRSYKHPYQLRNRILAQNNISLTLDAGAAVGDYILQLRRSGYTGRVISFEPMAAPYATLRQRAGRDPYGKWEAIQCGLAAESGYAEIHVSENSVSSSLLPLTEAHTSIADPVGYVAKERIALRPLADFADKIAAADRVFLKMDVQGYEYEVLRGAGEVLNQVRVIECELSLAPMYKGQMLYREMIAEFEKRGFETFSFTRGCCDWNTGKLLQMDGIFVRSDRNGD